MIKTATADKRNAWQGPLWAWAVAWLALALISTFIRLYPLRAHLWDDTHEQATLLVLYEIKQAFVQGILQQSPGMPLVLVNRLAEEKLNETLHTENKRVLKAIEGATLSLIKQQNVHHETIYLLESDPYYYYNLTENIIAKGRIADIVKGSKYFNPLMGAPFGYWQPFTLHPYVGFWIYKTARLFNPNLPLMTAVALTPLFISLLSLIAFLWVCRLLNYSLIASFIGALFLNLAPIHLKRSALGWYDTDPYNILFPLLLLGCLLLALQPKTRRRACLWAVMCGLTMVAYALFWQGWGLLFLIALACALAAAATGRFLKKNNPLTRQSLLFVLVFSGVALLGTSICFGFKDFFVLFEEGLGELRKFTAHGLDLWPNLFLVVGELKKPSFQEIMATTGGPVFILLAALGWIYSLWLAFKELRHPRTIATLIVTIFLGVTVFITLGAERFALLTLIPLSLLATLAVERFLNFRFMPVMASIILIPLVLYDANRDIRTVLTPIFNSAWEKALVKIKTDTPPDSIINTWWAPGHFIKGIAHRRVPFDGASLNEGAIGYWMANVFLSQDERRARGLLRMLNGSGNKSFEFLTQCGLKPSQAVALLNALAPKTKGEAAAFLKPLLNQTQAQALLSLTHGKPTHSYVLVYNELVEDNLMLTFTGRRNFVKIEELNRHPRLLAKIPGRNSPDLIDFLWGIAGGPSKYSDAFSLMGQKENQLIFRDNLTINLTTMEATIQSPQFGNGKPLSVVTLDGDHIVEHAAADGNLNYSVVLYQQDNQYTARLMDGNLANSLIIKLFFFDGQGLRCFKPLISTHDLTGRTQIKVFEVLWEDQ